MHVGHQIFGKPRRLPPGSLIQYSIYTFSLSRNFKKSRLVTQASFSFSASRAARVNGGHLLRMHELCKCFSPIRTQRSRGTGSKR